MAISEDRVRSNPALAVSAANIGRGFSDALTNISTMYGRRNERDALLETRRQERQDRLAVTAENRRRYESKEAKALEQRTIASDFAKSYNKQWQVDRWIANNPDKFKGINDIRAINREVLSRNTLRRLTLSEDGITIANRFDGKVFKGDDDRPISSDFDKSAEQIERLNSLGLLGEGIYKEYTGRLEKLDNDTNKFILDALPMYQGQALSNISTYLIGKGLDPINAVRLGESFTRGFQNKKDLTARSIAQQKIEQKRENDVKTAAYRVYRARNSRNGRNGSSWSSNYQKGPKKGFQDIHSARAYIQDTFVKDKNDWFKDLHGWEEDKLVNYWDQAQKAGVDRNVAMRALGEFVIEGPIWGKDVKGNVKDFVIFAQSLGTLGSGGAGSFAELTAMLTPKEVPYKDAVERNMQAFLHDLGLLGPQPNYRIPNKRKLTDNKGKVTTETLDPNSNVEETSKLNDGAITPEEIVTKKIIEGEELPVSQINAVEKSNAERYKTDAANVVRTNKAFPGILGGITGDTISSKTLFVYPYGAKGKTTEWLDQVNDANSRSAIRFGDEINNVQAEAAIGNPKLQAEHLTRINSLIAADMRVQAASGEFFGNSARSIIDIGTSAFQSIGDLFNSDANDIPKRNRLRKLRLNEAGNNALDYDRLEAFISSYDKKSNSGSGVADASESLDKFTDSFSTFVGNSPSASNTLTGVGIAASMIPAAKILKTVAGPLGSGFSAARNILNPSSLKTLFRGKNPFKRKPTPTTARDALREVANKIKPKPKSTPSAKSVKKQYRKGRAKEEISRRETSKNLREQNAPGQKPRLDQIKENNRLKDAVNVGRKWLTKRAELESLASKGKSRAIKDLKEFLPTKPRYRLPAL